MPGKELVVLLEQVHGDRQHAAQHVGQPVAELVQEGLKDVPGLGYGDHACSPRVVDSVMEVVHTARVHDLLPADVRAHQLPDGLAELQAVGGWGRG